MVDLTQTARQVGAGQPLYVHFNVVVAADFTTTDETYQFNVATGAAATLGTVLTSRIITAAVLVEGFNFSMQIPSSEVLRYIGVEYVLGGTTPTVTMDAYISDQEQYSWVSTADAI